MTRRQQLDRPGPPPGPPADDTGCPILHVDMDAFFAAVEVLDQPGLRGRPVIVGTANRGVVLSATYQARSFGVHSAMPVAQALRLCPAAVLVPPRHQRYAEVSAAVHRVFQQVTPVVEPIASDEAFLDVSGAIRRLGRPAVIGQLIREQVAAEQGITCSVGIGATKFVAKLASQRAKPDGLLVVPAEGTLAFLHPLPVGRLWGVGERTEQTLHALGLRTVGDLAAAPPDTLRRAVGKAAAVHLHALSRGEDPRPVVPDVPDRSIGAEETFERDLGDTREIHRALLALSERTAARLRRSGSTGRTVSIKIRYSDFTTVGRSRTLHSPTDSGQQIFAVVRELYGGLGAAQLPIRLVGVRVESLAPAETAARQLVLGERDRGWREADRAVDEAVRRFGTGVVRPASLLPREGPSAS